MKRTVIDNVTKGLAGAVMIAGGSSAYAAIVVVSPPADLTNTPGGGTQIPGAAAGVTGTFSYWDVNSDGTNDFLFSNRYPNSAAGSYGVVWQENMGAATTALATTNGIISYQGSFVRYANALTLGTNVGTGGAFSTATTTLGSRYSYGGNGISNYGGFASGLPGAVTPGTNAYVGFRFNAADGTHYGWALLNVNTGLIDFSSAAYQNTPATAITAGAVPEPGTMAFLALGAAAAVGTIVKRRRTVAA